MYNPAGILKAEERLSQEYVLYRRCSHYFQVDRKEKLYYRRIFDFVQRILDILDILSLSFLKSSYKNYAVVVLLNIAS
jgi:hypothetical protein